MMYAEYKMQEVCKDKVKTKKQHISVPETLPERETKVRTNRHDTEEKENLQKMDRNDPKPVHLPIDDAHSGIC